MSKEVLRERLKAERLALTPEQVAAKSGRIIYEALGEVVRLKARSIHCFTSIAELNEVDTTGIFTMLWDRHPQIDTFTSQKVGGQWQQGKMSPEGFKSVDELPKLDIIFVPCLGFDNHQQRIGYGAGWYDRFLATQPGAAKIGLAFEMGRLVDLPAEAHDAPLTKVITEL